MRKNPRDQWIAIPVPHSGIPRELVDTARALLKNNRSPGKTGRRFWQLPSGAVRCKTCGKQMHQYAAAAGDKIYAYYKCARLIRFGKDGCCPDRVRTNHRAGEVEQRVWEFVSDLMKDPEELRADLERMIELEKRSAHGDPARESKTWLEKLSEVGAERRGYIKLAARGSITDAELDEALAELEEARSIAEHELATLHNQQEAIEALERDKEALLDYYASIAPEALDILTPEERHQLYRMLRLEVVVRPDANLEVSGVFGEDLLVSDRDLVSKSRAHLYVVTPAPERVVSATKYSAGTLISRPTVGINACAPRSRNPHNRGARILSARVFSLCKSLRLPAAPHPKA